MLTPTIVVLAAVLALAAVVAPAGAKAPEENGQIVFARFDPLLEDDFIYTVNPDGTGLTAITSGGLSSSPDWVTHPPGPVETPPDPAIRRASLPGGLALMSMLA
jgi:hypothetical protein